MFEATEKEIQKAILEYLEYSGIFHYRQNSGAYKADHGSFIRFGTKGAPDIVCVIRGQYIGLEIKGPRGKQNENQKEFQRLLEESGGKYLIIRSLDEVIDLCSEQR